MELGKENVSGELWAALGTMRSPWICQYLGFGEPGAVEGVHELSLRHFQPKLFCDSVISLLLGLSQNGSTGWRRRFELTALLLGWMWWPGQEQGAREKSPRQ